MRYQWRNSQTEAPYTKIAYIVKVVFRSEAYYMGAGFTFGMTPALKGVGGASCPGNYNLPCAIKTTSDVASHVQAHVISSTAEVQATFNAISYDPTSTFKAGAFYAFYAFFYDFNSTCVTHGARPDFVGKTLAQVFALVNIPLNADALHVKFTEAAQSGGGWVLYDWTNPQVPGSSFQKIAYIFKFSRDSREYYGGVGFTHAPSPTQAMLGSGR
eukprot:COSAG01_NODE_2719_length_7188_cov_6.387079_4_plen_214_part_00